MIMPFSLWVCSRLTTATADWMLICRRKHAANGSQPVQGFRLGGRRARPGRVKMPDNGGEEWPASQCGSR
jgi:hypothetical protein